MKLVAYTRVSTDTQDISHEVQADAIRSYCKAHGHELSHIIPDTHSGSTNLEKSDAWGLIMDQLTLGHADGVIVYKLDRLSRSLIAFATLVNKFQDAGHELVCVSEQLDFSTATGRMIARMLMTFAEYERELIGERTKAALQAKKAGGQQLGRPRKYEVSGHVFNQIHRKREDGHSLAALANDYDLPISVIRRVLS